MKIKISLCQMDVTFGQPDNNLSKATKYIAEAGGLASNLVLLPELWYSGYDLSHAADYAHPLGSGIFKTLSELAKQFNIAVGGTSLEAFEGKLFNTFTIFDHHGELTAFYRKIHLFRPIVEHSYLAPGNSLSIAEMEFGRAGMAICYDLRFPEMFRQLAVQHAQFFLLPAEWPKQRTNHWHTLIRARAIENQIPIAAVNRVGVSVEGSYGGCSALIDAWGDTVVEGDSNEGLFTGEIELDQTERIRRRFNVLKDRRPDVY